MPLRVAVCLAVAVGLVLPAMAHASHVVRPISVSARTTVPAGGAATLALRCPGSAVALNAAVTSQGDGVRVRRSIPGREADDWSFRLGARAGAAERGARAVLRCVRIAVPDGVSGTRLEVSTQRRSGIAIDPGASKAVRLGCGRAWSGTGYGLSRGTRGDVRVAAAVPTAHGWIFRLENVGAAEATAGVSARCLRTAVVGRRDGGRVALRFRALRREFDDVSVSGGTVSFLHRCRRDEFSLATGSAVDPLDPIALVGSTPVGSLGGRWTFARSSPGDAVTTQLVCLSRRPEFG